MKRRKEQGVSYCRYIVIEILWGLKLMQGFKYKDFTNMQPDRCFRPFPFLRKIYEYSRVAKLNGRLCYITYWTEPRRRARRFSCLTRAGIQFSMDGTTADLNESGDSKIYDGVIREKGLRSLTGWGMLSWQERHRRKT